MIDRLISGAGAISAATDRFVRSIMPGTFLSDQPASLLAAGLLGVTALVLVVVGLEATGSSTLRTMDPAATVAAADLPNRTYATMSGRVPSTYVESYADRDFDGVQDPDEDGAAWDYYLLGRDSATGVIVRSERSPSQVYTFRASGVVTDDREYVQADIDYLGTDYSMPDLTIDPDSFIDTRSGAAGVALDLAEDVPPDGTQVTVEGARLIEFLTVCSSDPDGDGACTDDEVDLYDIVVYDPVSRRAIVVLTDVDPTYQDATFTGVLRRDARAVSASTATEGVDLARDGIAVSPVYLLEDGAETTDGTALFALAAVAGLAAGVLAAGVLGGYVIYRRDGALPAGARSLAPGERVALAVTGRLRTASGLVHVREAPADLVRFVLAAPETAPDTGITPDPGIAPEPASEPASTLILERRDRPEGVAVGRGELVRLSTGTVTTFRARRPGLRLRAGTGVLMLSFDDAGARDRAAAELVEETGIGATAPRPTEEDS